MRNDVKLMPRMGLAKDSGVLVLGELGFNTDTEQLTIGLGDRRTHTVDIVVAKEGILYAETPEGYIPLCIKID